MIINSRFNGTCRNCGTFLPRGSAVSWTKGVKGVTCVRCPATPEAKPAPKPRITSGTDFEVAAMFLRGRANPNEFEASLLRQLDRGLTERQIEAVTRTLREERDRMLTQAATSALAAEDASTGVVDAPRRESLPGADVLPAGRYAVRRGDDVFLIRVWRGRRNPNYVKLVRQFTDGGYVSERGIARAEYADWMRRIVGFGVEDASILYGKNVGRCGICGKRLTDRVSVEMGIGPVCGRRVFGNSFGARVTRARASLQARGINPDERVEEVNLEPR